jgi:hypothetical protein
MERCGLAATPPCAHARLRAANNIPGRLSPAVSVATVWATRCCRRCRHRRTALQPRCPCQLWLPLHCTAQHPDLSGRLCVFTHSRGRRVEDRAGEDPAAARSALGRASALHAAWRPLSSDPSVDIRTWRPRVLQVDLRCPSTTLSAVLGAAVPLGPRLSKGPLGHVAESIGPWSSNARLKSWYGHAILTGRSACIGHRVSITVERRGSRLDARAQRTDASASTHERCHIEFCTQRRGRRRRAS